MLKRTSHIQSALALSALLLLAACGGGGEESPAVSAGGTTVPGTSGRPGTGGAVTGAATLSWMPPAENIDGSTVTNLAGYRVYRGGRMDNLSLAQTIGNPGITTVVLEGLASGTHYFAVSAFLTSGAESDPSPVGSKTIP